MPDSTFANILMSLDAFPVLGKQFSAADFVHLDLSKNNKQLQNVDVSSSNDLEQFIWKHIENNKAKIAFGGYLEKRGIYNRSSHFNKQNPETERNIHLGVDLWIEAKTPIYAPLDAEIHSFANNTNHGDYGPTIILKHNVENETFFTLYGHLSLRSIKNIKIGQKLTKGEQIATLGTAKINGDYPPHLHFQIIKDIQDFIGDYPGVSNILDLEFYKRNCPDGKLLLGLIK